MQKCTSTNDPYWHNFRFFEIFAFFEIFTILKSDFTKNYSIIDFFRTKKRHVFGYFMSIKPWYTEEKSANRPVY